MKDLLSTVDAALETGHRRLRTTLGRRGVRRLVGYRSWVRGGKATVLGRVVEDDMPVLDLLARGPRVLRSAYDRFATLPAAGATVRVSWQGASVDTVSGTHGFIDVSLHAPRDAPPGGTARLELAGEPSGAAAECQVFDIRPGTRVAIISDIDDTVLETELTNPWRRAAQLTFSASRTRVPFDGIAALYEAFTRSGHAIFYVSNAPWNLYTPLVELLDAHRVPPGPLLLRDMGLVERRATEEGVHKQRALRRLADAFPELDLVLIGDSSRSDPVRYVELAELTRGRVKAIYIRKVNGWLARSDDLGPLQARAARAGVELIIADRTVAIAEHARQAGLVAAGGVTHVVEGELADRSGAP